MTQAPNHSADPHRHPPAGSTGLKLAAVAIALAALGKPLRGSLMQEALSSTETRQPYRDIGARYLGSVGSLFVDGEFTSSCVVIGHGDLVLLTAHQLKLRGVTFPLNKQVEFSFGPNYFHD